MTDTQKTAHNPADSHDTLTVNCDGTKEDAGHPRVFIRLNKKGYAICPYCNREFYAKPKKTD